MSDYTPDYPIVLGICGQAGTGKTSTADRLAPLGGREETPIDWDHLYFALPLYEIVSIKRNIEGDMRKDRIRYELHKTLVDLFGSSPLYGAPKYDTLVQLVQQLTDTPLGAGESEKPRSFLQQTGTLLRDVNEDCFVNWVKKMIKTRYVQLRQEGRPYAFVVSDVRMPNEAAMIKAQPNGRLLKFTASDEVRHDRLMKRDGFVPDAVQAAHASEQVDLIPNELFDHIIDTNSLSLDQQARVTEAVVNVWLEETLEPVGKFSNISKGVNIA